MWLAFASTVLLASVQPAKAQEAFECLTEDGPSLLFKLVGRAPPITGEIRIRFREKTWTSVPSGKYASAERDSGREIDVSDSHVYWSADLIKFDIGLASRDAEVRLLKTTEGGKTVYGGTFRLIGVGIWGLRCEGNVGARL